MEFVGEANSEIEFIGRYEHLAEHLLQALEVAGESFDEKAIRKEPPFNVSNKHDYPAVYTDELEEMIKESERYAMTRFNYD
jgi:hypothetical protein